MAERVTETGRTTIQIELTPQQKAQIRQATRKDVGALELTPELREARISPAGAGGLGGGN